MNTCQASVDKGGGDSDYSAGVSKALKTAIYGKESREQARQILRKANPLVLLRTAIRDYRELGNYERLVEAGHALCRMGERALDAYGSVSHEIDGEEAEMLLSELIEIEKYPR